MRTAIATFAALITCTSLLIAAPGRAPRSKQRIVSATESSSITEAARQIDDMLAAAKSKKMVVIDFVQPDSAEWDRLGEKLAEDLRVALKSGMPKVDVISNAKVLKSVAGHEVDQGTFGRPPVGFCVTGGVEPRAWVFGTFDTSGPEIKLSLQVYARDWGTSTKQISVTIPRTPEVEAMRTPALADPLADVALAPRDKRAPSCVYCPQAQYSDIAVLSRLQGTVVFEAVVQTNGKLSRITLLRGLPLGLNDTALAAVKTWRLQPAADESGKPIAVRQTIEVQFHLY